MRHGSLDGRPPVALTAALAVTLLVAAPLGASAQRGADSTRPAPIHGRLLGVYDEQTGAPIVGALVSDALTGDHTTTSGTGTVSLWFVRAKGSIVEVRKLGYEPWSSVIDPADTVPVTVVLKKVTQLAPTLTMAAPNIAKDPGLREGFERRCQTIGVTCVREDVIDTHADRTIGDLIARAPGIVCGHGPGCGILMHSLVPTGSGVPTAGRGAPAGASLCVPTYFIDGHVWDVHSLQMPIDNPGATSSAPFTPSTVKQVEVYSPEVPRPLRFAGNPICGAIVIWTK
jgi:hypothetical protein